MHWDDFDPLSVSRLPLPKADNSSASEATPIIAKRGATLVRKAADGLCEMAAAETLVGGSSTRFEHFGGGSAVLPTARHGGDSAHHGGDLGISYFALHRDCFNGTHLRPG